MSMPTVALLGELATHPRGKNLGISFQAKMSGEPPEAGAAMVFGKEFQTSLERAEFWVSWAGRPGRLLLIVPPYNVGFNQVPTAWEVRRVSPLAGGESNLSRILAAERVHELRGSLMPLERVGGAIVTGGWRRHSAAGLVVWTTNPLWSLTALDHTADCRTWIEDLYSQCGAAAEMALVSEHEIATDLSAEEWIMLLHLCTGPYPTESDALAALKDSQLLKLDEEQARKALQQLQSRNLVAGVTMCDAAEGLLAASRYDAFARELRRLANG